MQENIVLVKSPTTIKHPLLNTLFRGFSEETQGYIPNPELKKLHDDLLGL